MQQCVEKYVITPSLTMNRDEQCLKKTLYILLGPNVLGFWKLIVSDRFKSKGKSHLKQAMKLQRRNSDLDVWVVHGTPRPLYPRERDPVRILQEAM
jgi:hypothetical protein